MAWRIHDSVIHRADGFNPMQRGSIGNLTASRKVRVFDLPLEEALESLHQGLPVPEHMANSLYLEWFNEANGRVVITHLSRDRFLFRPPQMPQMQPTLFELDAEAGMFHCPVFQSLAMNSLIER